MKVRDTVANPVLRQIFAGTPRITCTACGAIFLRGAIMLRLTTGKNHLVQEHLTCPQCKAVDTLREATPEEVAAVSPEPTQWARALRVLLWAVAAVGGALFLYVLFVTRGRA